MKLVYRHHLVRGIMLQRFLAPLFLVLSLLLAGCNLVNQAEVTAEPTLDIPTIEIRDPSNNRQIVEGTEFSFDIVAQDSGAGISQINLYIDETLIGEAFPLEDEEVPIFRASINWLAQGQGNHFVEAIAYRLDGTESDAAEIVIEVIASE
jgi:hypothetical protein